MASTLSSLSRVASFLLATLFVFAVPAVNAFAKDEVRQEVLETVDFMGAKVFRTSYGKQTQASMQGLTAVHPNSKDFKSRDQILDGKWKQIFITPARVYVRNEWNDPYYYVPLERTKKGWKAGAPVPTPYIMIVQTRSNPTPAFVRKPVWLGLRERLANNTEVVDILGENGVPTITLDRVAPGGLPSVVAMLSDTTLGAYFLDEAGNKVFGVMDRSGRFLGPPLPKVEVFTPYSDFYAGGDAPYQLFAAALDGSGKRYLPLTIEGLLPIETVSVKSYRPLDFISDGKVTRFGKRIHSWLKEYDDNGVTYWGWCSADLTIQTGPIWRSIERLEIYQKRYYLAQLRDGSWMTYEPNDETGRWGVRFAMPHPMREKSEPEKETVLADVGSRFINRGLEQLKDPIFNQKVEPASAPRITSAWDLSKYTPHLKEKANKLENAIYIKDWIEAESVARDLGGDYWVRYIVARRWHNGPISAAYWYQLMSQTEDEKLRAQVTQIYNEKAAGDARYFAESARNQQLAADQQRANEYEQKRAAKAWMLSGGGLKMPSDNKPTSAERTETVNRYFSELDKYQRGQQTWEPPVPTVLGK